MLLFLQGTAQAQVHIITEPHSLKLFVGMQAPPCHFFHVYLYIIGKRKQQAGSAFVLKNMDILESASVFENPYLCQQIIDSILPLLQGTAAFLENQAIVVLYPVWFGVLSQVFLIQFPSQN